MSAFMVPIDAGINAGDIVAAIKNALLSQYKDRGWYVGIAETNTDVIEMLHAAADGGSIILKWMGDDEEERPVVRTLPVVLNSLSVVVKRRTIPTAAANVGIVQSVAGVESFTQSISDLRKLLLCYRFMVNDRYYAFPDEDVRGPLFSRLMYFGTKPVALANGLFDVFELQFKFRSSMDVPSFAEGDPDAIAIQITQQGKPT